MSIADFSDAFKNRIFTQFTGLSRSNRALAVQNQDTNFVRKQYESATSGASAVFTKTGLINIGNSITNTIQDQRLAKYANEIFKSIDYNNFLSYVEHEVTSSRRGNLSRLDDTSFRISNVPQKTLRNYFLEYLSIILEVSDNKSSHTLLDYVSKHIHSGHLAGVFSLKLVKNFGLEAKYTGSSYRDFTLSSGATRTSTEETLEVILKALLDADYLTSNIVDKENIFLSATKAVLSDNPHLEVELQFSKDNEASGNLLKEAGTSLNKLLKQLTTVSNLNNTDADSAFRAFISTLRPLVIELEKHSNRLKSGEIKNANVTEGILNNTQKLSSLVDTLANTKGSPSLVSSIGIQIANTLRKAKTTAIITKTTIKTKTKTKDLVSNNINSALKKINAQIKEVKRKANNKPVVSIKQSKTKAVAPSFSLASLQALLDTHLQDVVSANMGSGSDRRVLNYRTGRLASSAKVERLTGTRDGMITAFYSYMRNPYGTFSDGGKQQYPRTRDPKLLIAGAIREIAATQVGNRMRAVLV